MLGVSPSLPSASVDSRRCRLHVKYDQIMGPSFQTKSAIWKHFGFPTDDTGAITNKKTVCRLLLGTQVT